MSDQKLTVSLILNSSSFTKQIQDVNRQVKLTESEFGKVSSSTKDFASSIDGARSKLKNLTDKLELQSKKVSLYKNEVGKTETTLSELTKRYSEVDDSLKSTNKKYDEACQKYGKNSNEAKALKEEITKLEKSKLSLENRIVSTNGKLTSLQTELNKSEKDFNELEKEVSDASNALNNFKANQVSDTLNNLGDDLNSTGDKFKSAGKKISGVGNTLMLGVAAPLIGVGTAASKVSVDFEQAMAKVQSTSGASSEQLEQLEEKAKSLGKEIAGASASDIADSFNYLAMAGYNTNEMLEAIEPNVKASIAFGADMATVTDLATDSMSAMGLEAKDMTKYLDMVAQVSRNANTSGTQLMEAYIECGATMTKMNVPLHESAKVLAVLADNGLKGSQAGNSMQSVMVNLMGTTSTTAGALEELGVQVYDQEGKFRGLERVLEDVLKGAEKMTDEQADMALAALGGKSQLTALNNALKASGDKYDDLEEKIANSNGTLEEMYQTMSNTTHGGIETLKSQLESIGIQLGEILLPVINDFMAKLSELLTWFSNLSPSVKESIVKFGAFAIASSVATKSIGGLTSGIGSVMKVGGGLAKLFAGSSGITASIAGVSSAAGSTAAISGLSAFASGLGAVAVAAAPFVAAGAAVGVTAYAVNKHMSQDIVPAVDLFCDKVEYSSKIVKDEFGNMRTEVTSNVTEISDATEAAVGSYIAMDDGVRNSLYGMYTSSSVITNDIVTEMQGKFGQLGEKIKQGYEETCNENTEILSGFFADSSALTEESEKGILEKTNQYYSDKKLAIQGYQDEINQILQNAANENRELTEQEYLDITDIQNKMREESINALSEQELEASLILERMKSYDGRMTTEMASEHIKNLNKQRDESISAAEEEYDEVVKSIIKMRDETGTISAEQADKLIEEAERQRDETIKKAQETRDGAVAKMEELNKDLKNSVNTTTGDIKTKWDELKDWWNNWKPKAKNFVANIFSSEKKSSTSSATSSSGNSSRMLDMARMPMMTSGYSDEMGISTAGLTDSLYVPSARDVATEMRNAGINTSSGIGKVEENSNNKDSELTSALQSQNELLMQMVGLLAKNNGVNVALEVDGRQFAKATAKYIDTEINTINQRKTRLGGAF